MQLRPEQLAQLIQTDDHAGLMRPADFRPERAKKILAAFRQNVDPLRLEVVEIEDVVRIELNVATSAEATSRMLPSFLAARSPHGAASRCCSRGREDPLVIDQPEDNLDNHFIYETVVESIQRLRRSAR